MSDIDFDELDRAVNGALNKTAAVTPASQQPPAVNTAPEIPTVRPIQRTTLTAAPSVTPPTSSNTPAPAVRRASGRFMDMVHPSSDMRSSSHANAVAQLSRPEPTSFTSSSAQPAPLIQPTSPTPSSEVIEQPDWNEPIESPFLPDAKVEKRPLGGAPEDLLEAPEPQQLLEAHTMPDPIDFAAAMAVTEEMESKHFESEASDSQDIAKIVELATAHAEVEADSQVGTVSEPQLAQTPQQSLKEPVEEPAGPTSITPQYKAQPSTNQESGAMYDTESYHQPVTVPAKKKSGWLTIVGIVLLVLLGAGAGWAVFTFVL